MSDAQKSDPYDLVLADLRAQRQQIDQTIALLEALRNRPALGAMAGITPSFIGGAGLPTPEAPAAAAPHTDAMGPGAFLGLTIVDAAKKLLAQERRQLNNSQIFEAFKRGGLILNSADPLNTVGSVLNRRFQQVGDIVRVARGTWGLKEWYPNRSFKSAKQGEPKSELDPNAVFTPPDPAADFAGVTLPASTFSDDGGFGST
jgi:hypothetical protein